MSSDEELMQEVAQGNLTAFEVLVRRHQLSAWNVAYRLLGDAHEAEDIAQEAFLRVLRAAPRYQPTAAFRTYLYRILNRLCRDRRRKHLPSSCSNPDAEISPRPLPADCAIAGEERLAVQNALGSLPAGQREVIVYRYYESLSYDEIGAIIGSSRKGVERLLWRAREALGTLLRGLLQK